MKQIGSVQHVVNCEGTTKNPKLQKLLDPEPRLRYKVRRVKRKRSKVNNWQRSSYVQLLCACARMARRL